MAGGENRRIMEMQMDALKEEHGVSDGDTTPKNKHNNDRSENSRKIAKLYEDAAEYEEELEFFEKELEIINANELSTMIEALTTNPPNPEGNYEQELQMVLISHWTHFVEVAKTHPKEQLVLIEKTKICDLVATMKKEFSDYEGDFETEIKEILIKRWEMLVEIKKEHVADERAEMKLRGMKPDHIRKVYRKYHGLPE